MILVLPTVAGPPSGCATRILVGPGTIIKGVLLMTVKPPVRPGGALATGMLVDPGITTKGVPSIIVVLPGNTVGPEPSIDGAGKVVGLGMAKNGVSLITVVGPVIPGGAFTTGILVEDGTTINGDPLINVALAPGMLSGVGADEGTKVTGEGTTITCVPSICVACPGRPNGAAVTGMVVGFGMMILGPGEDASKLAGCVLVGQVPMIAQMALAIDAAGLSVIWATSGEV